MPTEEEQTREDRRGDEDDRRSGERRKVERRKSTADRRGRGPLDDRRARFTLFYFLAAFLVLLVLNYMFAGQSTKQIPYSELKQRIAAGQVERVLVGRDRIRAEVRDSLVGGAMPEVLTAVPVADDPDLIAILDRADVEYQGTTEGWLGTLLIWLLPLGLMVLFWVWILRRMNPAQGVMTVGKNRARIVGEEGTGVDFDDVAGADEAKQELVEVVEFLKTPEKFHRLGAKIPKGVLVVGPPGTGKTLLARAVAGEAGVTFFSISGSEFVEMFVGVGASRVRDLFQQAKTNAPCIVFIDELDALGKARGVGGVMGGNDEREQTLNQLLVEMDGFDPRTGVIIMGATNRPEILDPALLRPGRFDRQVLVDRPDMRGREAILHVHAKQIRLSRDVELAVIARRTPGFVGADLANLLNEAALLAARRDHPEVTMQDIDDAIDRIVAGLEKRNRLINDKERRIVAYHEAGHAIVAERVETADPVHKISIIPRGVSALGYTQQLPTDERFLMQRQELLDRLTVLLGGRAAERIVFDEISTGAGNDLERATEIARRMVAEFGMSQTLGPVTYGRRRRPMFLELNEDGADGRGYSEATAETLDTEVRDLVNGAYERATELLRAEREVLEQLATRLLEKEVVDREELRELMGVPAGEERDEEKPEVGHVPVGET
ncbi:MAG: ATP-dependent zinc metalloprotease FtsH [Longimicrobiales bacterium]